MLLGIALVALLTADLASHLVRAALGARRHNKVSLKGHFVICGWGGTDSFLVKGLTSDALPRLRHVVVVDEDLDDLPLTDPYVHFVRGSATEESVLDRASVHDAETVVIPLDWSLTASGLKDSRNTLIMLAVEARSPKSYTCVEIAKPDSKRHLSRTRVDEVVCVGELAQRLLTQAALNHGLSVFLNDVLTMGSGSRIHKEILPPDLAGIAFRQLLEMLNTHLEEVLLAVERAGQIHTNPSGVFKLEIGDYLFVLGDGSYRDLQDLGRAVTRGVLSIQG
jgi:voltage-gated potassium channel